MLVINLYSCAKVESYRSYEHGISIMKIFFIGEWLAEIKKWCGLIEFVKWQCLVSEQQRHCKWIGCVHRITGKRKENGMLIILLKERRMDCDFSRWWCFVTVQSMHTTKAVTFSVLWNVIDMYFRVWAEFYIVSSKHPEFK